MPRSQAVNSSGNPYGDSSIKVIIGLLVADLDVAYLGGSWMLGQIRWDINPGKDVPIH